MMPAQNRAAGMNVGFPDVCNTPAGPATVPVPYPNLAQNASATGFSAIVKVNMVNALNLASSMPTTEGDEAGTAHATVKGKGQFTSGSPKIFIEKQPAIHLLCPATGNQGNCPVAAALVPSSANVLFTDARRRGAEPPAEVASVDPYARVVALGDRGDLGEVADVTRAVVHAADDGTVVVTLASIGNDAGALVAEAAREARSLVLDLRGCPGGTLDGAVDLASRFLEEGAPVATLVDEDGDATDLRARAAGDLDLPLVLLVGPHTASAAEVVAAALAPRRALVVGARTAGKGWAQEARVGPVGDVLVHTRASLLGPGGEPIEGRGVVPHVLDEVT